MPEKTARIVVGSLKVTLPLKPDQLPKDLVPPEPAPVGEPVVELVLENGLTARAKINGKNYRRMLKQIAEQGAENVVIILQGALKPPAAKGGPYTLEGAGFQYTVKAPKPAGPAAGPAPGEGPERAHRWPDLIYPPPRLPGRRSTRRASGRSCRRWTAGASKA